MKKPIKSAIVCDKCGSILEPEHTESFCDYCKMKISDGEAVELTVFWKERSGGDAQNQEFCSLNHARQWLLQFPYNKEQVDFVALPYIHNMEKLEEFIGEAVGVRVKDTTTEETK
jgi:hypothetical protein